MHALVDHIMEQISSLNKRAATESTEVGDGDCKKLRVLFLHGGASDGDLAQHILRLTGWRDGVADVMEFITCDGPHPNAADFETFGTFAERGLYPNRRYCGWCFPTLSSNPAWIAATGAPQKEPEISEAWSQSVIHVQYVWRCQGPFDAIGGICEGAAAAILLAISGALHPKPRLVLAFGGYVSNVPGFASAYKPLPRSQNVNHSDEVTLLHVGSQPPDGFAHTFHQHFHFTAEGGAVPPATEELLGRIRHLGKRCSDLASTNCQSNAIFASWKAPQPHLGRARLLILPHSGGTASSYNSLLELFPKCVAVATVEYPGHGDRSSEALAPKLDTLANDILVKYRSWLKAPYYLLGHSFGSAVAVAMYHSAESLGLELPQHLFCSGRAAPHEHNEESARLGTSTGHELLELLQHLDSPLAPLLSRQPEDPELLRLVRILQHDANLAVPCPPTPLSKSSLSVFCSHHEAGQMAGWNQLAPASMHCYQGGHFYLLSGRGQVEFARDVTSIILVGKSTEGREGENLFSSNDAANLKAGFCNTDPKESGSSSMRSHESHGSTQVLNMRRCVVRHFHKLLPRLSSVAEEDPTWSNLAGLGLRSLDWLILREGIYEETGLRFDMRTITNTTNLDSLVNHLACRAGTKMLQDNAAARPSTSPACQSSEARSCVASSQGSATEHRINENVSYLGEGAFIDPSVALPKYFSIGRCAVIEAGVHLGPGVQIGEHVVIHSGVILEAKCRVGPYSKIAGPKVRLEEGCIVESHALIGPDVHLASNCKVANSVVLKGDVMLGEFCEVGDHSLLQGPIIVRKRTSIFPHCTIGTATRHLGAKIFGHIEIGDDCTIESHTNIFHATGLKNSDGSISASVTRLGNRVYVMPYSNIGHDVIIEDEVETAANLAGYVRIMTKAKLANNSCVHQFTTIGTCAFLAMGTTCRFDLLPFCVFLDGECSLDRVGLFKSGRSALDADQLHCFYQRTFSSPSATYARTVSVDLQLWFAKELLRFFECREAMRDSRPLATYNTRVTS
eukprot:TRINITY_DN33841_c0_g1_i1.p1 TRINITY_DN33841_c0_g1~~TRINITY_DN33841_c0_g1_i1.p1  ORF type:complete len:1153 (-),score=103.42 TRINITY_DN33841_c0_g1_i1:55-3114(-)